MRLSVGAAHPDDETLAAGGTIARRDARDLVTLSVGRTHATGQTRAGVRWSRLGSLRGAR